MTKVFQTSPEVISIINEIQEITKPLIELNYFIAQAKADGVMIDIATARTHINWLKAWANKSLNLGKSEIDQKKTRKDIEEAMKTKNKQK